MKGSFATLACALTCASAISLIPRSVNPRVVSLDTERSTISNPVARDRGRLARRAGTVGVTLDNEQTLYFANITLGTPPQSIQMHIDTGSSDLWVNTANSSLCLSREGRGSGCVGGTYSSSASSTYQYVNSDFNISYVDGSGATGVYATDALTIGGQSLNSFQFGIGDTSSSNEGVLGIGYQINEVQVNRAGGAAYPNLPAAMASAGLINSNAYSLWLNDLDANTGTILFGGVNTDKYHGELATVPILKEYNQFFEFTIALTGVAINDGGKSNTISATSLPTAALLDSGSSLIYLPDDVATSIFNSVNAVYSNQLGAAYVPCSLANNASTIDFTFSGAKISVSYSELVLDVATDAQGGQLTFQNGQPACVFGISPAEGSTPVLGDTFLRSAYVVYDLANNEISLAATNFNSTTNNIQEITKGTVSVPGATAVANPVTTVAAGTGGARIGGIGTATGTLGSNPTGLSNDMSNIQAPIALVALTIVGAVFTML